MPNPITVPLWDIIHTDSHGKATLLATRLLEHSAKAQAHEYNRQGCNAKAIQRGKIRVD